MTDATDRPALETALAELTERTLSRGERAAHLALTLFAATMLGVLALLLATEEGIPFRTSLAFWTMLAIAAAWTAFGLRVLSRRRPLLVNREVIAGRMALVFSSLFTLGTCGVGLATSGKLVTPATWLGLTMVLVALANLLRAHWRRSRLETLRRQLEQALAQARQA